MLLDKSDSSGAMSFGVVALGQIAGRLPMLSMFCNRCDRRGRLRTERLLTERSPDMPIPA